METTEEQRAELLKQGREAMGSAYAPYSNYPVGAALLTRSGNIYSGANVENAAYPLGICAERVAVFKAVTNRDLKPMAIAVISENGGSPCGACRQVLSEFGLDIEVILADSKGNIVRQTTVRELLPHAFGPSDLS